MRLLNSKVGWLRTKTQTIKPDLEPGVDCGAKGEKRGEQKGMR